MIIEGPQLFADGFADHAAGATLRISIGAGKMAALHGCRIDAPSSPGKGSVAAAASCHYCSGPTLLQKTGDRISSRSEN